MSVCRFMVNLLSGNIFVAVILLSTIEIKLFLLLKPSVVSTHK